MGGGEGRYETTIGEESECLIGGLKRVRRSGRQ